MTNRWETMETVTDFIFLGSKTTADGDCSHEVKRHLLLGRKVMTKLDSILKSRDITLPTKVLLVKVIVFPVIMISASASSSLSFHMMYSAYKLNKQGDHIRSDQLLSRVGLFATP